MKWVLVVLAMLIPACVDSGSYQSRILSKHSIQRTVVRIVSIEIIKKQEEIDSDIQLLEKLNDEIRRSNK